MEQNVEKKKANIVKAVDLGCRIISWTFLLFMVVLSIVSQTPLGEQLPGWLSAGSFLRKYLIPVLCSAAVGYLTNAFAIWMLFNPHEKHWCLPQGVIPRQKKSFGRELGILIPQHLLQPEKISAKIGKVALKYLKDPQFVQKIRDYVKSLLSRNSEKIAGVILPYVQDMVSRAIEDNLTREKFKSFCQAVVSNFTSDADTRKKTVRGAVAIFKDLLPQFSGELQKMVASRVAESFRKEHPVLSWLKETFSDKSVEDEVENFWRRGEKELLEELEQAETQEKIAEYFTRALLSGKAWTERPENAEKIEHFLLERRKDAEKYAGEYLIEKIPAFADDILSRDSFWIMLQEDALPAVQLFVIKQLRGHGDTIMAEFDIPGEIEKAVDGMDMDQLERFVKQASNDNLTLLQVFGFFLGGAAGLIMAFVL